MNIRNNNLNNIIEFEHDVDSEFANYEDNGDSIIFEITDEDDDCDEYGDSPERAFYLDTQKSNSLEDGGE